MGSANFLLIRSGDESPAVQDVQRKLADLGLLTQEAHGVFDEATVAAVQAFQHSRNLPADGIVGPMTWEALVEALWRLGDRVLYERHPPWLRGDDVAELQERLASLGFDVGKIDGIFGPLAREAVTELQRNSGLVPDGIAGAETLRMLERVSGAPAGKPSLTVRERLALRASATGLAGRRIYLDPKGGDTDPGILVPGGLVEADFSFALALELAASLGRHEAESLLSRAADTCPDPSERAALANWFGAEVVLGLGLSGDPPPADGQAMVFTSFFGTHKFTSSAGQELARLIGDNCALGCGLVPVPPQPVSVPLLRETRAVAVQIEFAPARSNATHGLGDPLGVSGLAASITASLEAFFVQDDAGT